MTLAARLDRLELAVGIAELERDADVAAGLVPPWARRGLLPHERRAGLALAAVDELLDRLEAELAAAIRDDSVAAGQRVADKLAADLTTAMGRAERTRRTRLRELLAIEVELPAGRRPDLEALLPDRDAWTQRYLNTTLKARAAGIREAIAEGARQGLPAWTVPDLTDDVLERLERVAARRAQDSYADVVRRIVTVVEDGSLFANIAEGGIRSAGQYVPPNLDELLAAGMGMEGAAGIVDEAAIVREGYGLGRQAAGQNAPRPSRVYASELLDRNTCGPCGDVDGTEYATIADGEVDYPTGTYKGCKGGPRCRGTLIYVWGEVDPDDPSSRPVPGDGPDNPGGAIAPTPDAPDAPTPDAPAGPPLTPRPDPASFPDGSWQQRAALELTDLPADAFDFDVAQGRAIATEDADGNAITMPAAAELEHEERLRRVGRVIEQEATLRAVARSQTIRAQLDELEVERQAVLSGADAFAREQLEYRKAWNARYGRSGAEQDRAARELAADPTWQAMVERSGQRFEQLEARRQELYAAQRALLPEARLEVLGEWRPMGGTYRTGAVDDAVAGTLEYAQARYPTAWVADDAAQVASGELYELTVRSNPGGRAFYVRNRGDGRSMIELRPGEDRTMLHELGHRQEDRDRRIGVAEWIMLRRRSTGADGVLEAPRVIYGSEVGRPDRWRHPYTGKEYELSGADTIDRHYELFETGIEGTLADGPYTDGDDELVEFILGILVAF